MRCRESTCIHSKRSHKRLEKRTRQFCFCGRWRPRSPCGDATRPRSTSGPGSALPAGCSRIVQGLLQACSRTVPKLFQSCSKVVPGFALWGRYAALCVAWSKLFGRRYRIAPKPLQSCSKGCSRLVPELFQSWSKVVPRFALRGRYAALNVASSKWFERCSTIAQAALAHCCPQVVPELSKDCSRLVQELFQCWSNVVTGFALWGRYAALYVAWSKLCGRRSSIVPEPLQSCSKECSRFVPELFQSWSTVVPRFALRERYAALNVARPHSSKDVPQLFQSRSKTVP